MPKVKNPFKKNENGLNDKQQRFVTEYLIDLNASAAARRAGYSTKTAGVQGFDLLRKTEIQAELKKAMESRAKRTEITQDRVLKELARLAFFDPRRILGPDGSVLPPDQWDADTAAAVASLEVVEDLGGENRDPSTTKKVKIFDKNTALTNAMRHLGMFEKDNSLNLTMGQVLYQANMPVRGSGNGGQGG